MRNIYAMIVSLFCCMTAWGQTPVGTVILKSPNDYQILSISPNGKWACGVYNDYSYPIQNNDYYTLAENGGIVFPVFCIRAVFLICVESLSTENRCIGAEYF